MSEPSPSMKWKVLLLMLAGAGAGGFASYGLLMLPGVLPSLRGASVYQLLALPVVFFAVILLHELGHLAAGAAAGMRPILLMVGPLKATRAGARWSVAFNRHLGTWGGMAAAVPVGKHATVRQLSALVAGGPLASLLLAVCALLGAHWLPNPASLLAAVTGWFSVLIFLCTAMPMRMGPMMSDGAQWQQLRRGGDEVKQRLLISSVVCQSIAGTRPRDLDADALRNLVANPPAHQAAFAHLLGLARSQDCASVQDVRMHAAALASMFDTLPSLLRPSVAYELAYTRAAFDGDAVAAEEWLRKSGRGVLEAYQPLRAQAAVALVQGRAAEASQLAHSAAKASEGALDRGTVVLVQEQLDSIARGRFREASLIAA